MFMNPGLLRLTIEGSVEEKNHKRYDRNIYGKS